ncbi:three component ABC system middle component [Rhodococcus maanshanensis]|uniref:three component ABC system middle component n=1 Tax=Rhodococcus maanshanensis TaxID=183556 RepID=UPI00350E472C
MEERALFNPAFIAVLLHRAVRSWERERPDGMHVILLFLIIPIALHSPTRARLPRTKKSPMMEWIQRNPDSMVYIPSNSVALQRKIGRGVELAIRSGVLVSRGTAIVGVGEVKRRTKSTVFTEDFDQCIKAADFLGKWFAQQNDYATILATWGVRP